MKKNEFTAQSGKTLMELLILLAIVGILVTMTVTRMSNAKSNLQRQNLAQEFKVNLERARFDSVKRRPSSLTSQSNIKIISATSYSISTDLNQNGTLDAAETRQMTFPTSSSVKIVGSNLTFPMTIRFDWRGQATVFNSLDQEINPIPSFYFCDGCTTQTANSTNSNIITISPTGTVAMTKGGATLPTFQSPNVSNINTSLGINPLVKVNGN